MARLFAHRGFVTESHPENTVSSLKEAVDQGFDAIEFDLWFVSRRIVIKHNMPEENEIDILPDLAEFFAYKNALTYWCDFKNLEEENVARALLVTKSEIETAEIKLDQIYFAPYITDFAKAEKIYIHIRNIFGAKAKIVAVCDSLKNEQDAVALRQFLDKNNVKALSIFHQLLNQKSMPNFSGIEIFAWTVNDLTTMKELEALGVTNFATDKITPQIYAGKTIPRTS